MPSLRIFAFLIAFMLATPPLASAIPQKGVPAPPFSVTSTSGQHITLANYRGTVLLMDYFATWCTPCSYSSEYLIQLSKTYGRQGLQVLGLSLDEDGETAAREYAASHRLNFPVALAGEELQTSYAIRSVPTLYVIGKNGRIAEKFMGFNDDIKMRLDTLIRRLLAE